MLQISVKKTIPVGADAVFTLGSDDRVYVAHPDSETIGVYNLQTCQHIQSYSCKSHPRVDFLRVSRDCTRLVKASVGVFECIDLRTNKQIHYQVYNPCIKQVEFDRNNNLLLLNGSDFTLFDLTTLRWHKFDARCLHHKHFVYSARLHRAYVACAHHVRCYDVADAVCPPEYIEATGVHYVFIAHDCLLGLMTNSELIIYEIPRMVRLHYDTQSFHHRVHELDVTPVRYIATHTLRALGIITWRQMYGREDKETKMWPLRLSVDMNFCLLRVRDGLYVAGVSHTIPFMLGKVANQLAMSDGTVVTFNRCLVDISFVLPSHRALAVFFEAFAHSKKYPPSTGRRNARLLLMRYLFDMFQTIHLTSTPKVRLPPFIMCIIGAYMATNYI